MSGNGVAAVDPAMVTSESFSQIVYQNVEDIPHFSLAITVLSVI